MTTTARERLLAMRAELEALAETGDESAAVVELEKALEIEYNYLHFSEQAVDDCLQISNPCDIHLNICAILSQMGKHELALQHSMKALILIQDELVSKCPGSVARRSPYAWGLGCRSARGWVGGKGGGG